MVGEDDRNLSGYWNGVSERRGRDYSEWPGQSELKKRYGYSVAKGVSIFRRRDVLRRAVEDANGLGLEKVANHIASFIRLGKLRNDDNMMGAVERWTEDLEWLQRRYFLNGMHNFRWPSTEPDFY